MPREPKRNLTAFEATVKALRGEGRLSPVDEALVACGRRLADACDAAPGNAALWREYRAALASLMEVGTDVGDSDEAAAFAESVRAPVGNGQKS